MELSEFISELEAKISDLGLSVSSPITEDNVDDPSPDSPVMGLFNLLVDELSEAYSVLGFGKPEWNKSDGPIAFAKAVGYPYKRTDIPFVIDFLVSELQAVRLSLSMRRVNKAQTAPVVATLSSELVAFCKLLSIPATEDALKAHPERAIAQIKAKVAKLLEKVPVEQFESKIKLLDGKLATPKVMGLLTEINDILKDDYKVRREMLIKRLDVTVQSFLWSAKVEGREGEIMSSIAYRRRGLAPTPAAIRPEDAFIAGPELAALLSQRVTDASTHSLRHSSVKSVLIGAVPDRGGRVGEMKLSARDLMPEWQPRKADPAGRGGASKAHSAPAGKPSGGSAHDARARELLAEAAKFEGEAKQAAADYDEVADDDADEGTAASKGKARGGRGRGRGRGGKR